MKYEHLNNPVRYKYCRYYDVKNNIKITIARFINSDTLPEVVVFLKDKVYARYIIPFFAIDSRILIVDGVKVDIPEVIRDTDSFINYIFNRYNDDYTIRYYGQGIWLNVNTPIPTD